MIKMEFSVCISVYKNDSVTCFTQALQSVLDQTLRPNEIVLVVDGPVGRDLNDIIIDFESTYPFIHVIRLEYNCGHAIARQTALVAAKHELIAIMDSDDIAVKDRFEKQINIFKNSPDVDVLGGQIFEFINDTTNVIGIRKVPLDDSNIKKYLKSRCPMNLVTVMMKKSAVLKVGGYVDWYCEEDYYLWIRMVLNGCKFANIPDNLVYVRVGDEMYQRRGGYRYFKSEAKLQYFMLQNKVITLSHYSFNIIVRLIVQVLMPNKIRGFVFQKLFRQS